MNVPLNISGPRLSQQGWMWCWNAPRVSGTIALLTHCRSAHKEILIIYFIVCLMGEFADSIDSPAR